MLLLSDASVVNSTRAATSKAKATVSVRLELPFATPPRTVTWSQATGMATLLEQPEQSLRFSLRGLPDVVNQDCRIQITLADGKNFSKWRRLMRAPPLPRGASALPVQVDHTTKSLLVDGVPCHCLRQVSLPRTGEKNSGLNLAAFPLAGRPHAAVGFYLDSLIGPHAGYPNLTEYIVHAQAVRGLGHGMIYRLFSYPPAFQLNVLDQLAAVGFKVIYDVCPRPR